MFSNKHYSFGRLVIVIATALMFCACERTLLSRAPDDANVEDVTSAHELKPDLQITCFDAQQRLIFAGNIVVTRGRPLGNEPIYYGPFEHSYTDLRHHWCWVFPPISEAALDEYIKTIEE